MVPRADIDAVDAEDTLAELILSFRNAGHSRLPVYEETLDNIVGFVHIKDALQKMTEEVPVDRERAQARPAGQDAVLDPSGAVSAPRTWRAPSCSCRLPCRCRTCLQQMQATHVHMAIVVDEYGGTDGLVSIEDLLESVVGDIEDEHDEDDGPMVRKIDEGTFLADARVELDELHEELGPDFDPGEHLEEVDTLGGLAVQSRGPRAGPGRGESQALQGLRIRGAFGRCPPHQAGPHHRQESAPAGPSRR